MQSWIITYQAIRGMFIAGLLLSILFGGEPSLLEAIVAWIGRN